LPRGITQEQAFNSRFAITRRDGCWHSQFRLERGKIEYTDRLGNQLKVFWNDDEPAPQPAIVSSENQTITAPPVQQKEKISLLNTPKRQDEWYEVINETVNQFYAENEVMPTATQVWNLLSTQPPTGYAITTGNDKGEICLNMAGCRLLSKSAFQERWRKYTK